MPLIDATKVQKDAEDELRAEAATAAKTKIKASLRSIAAAKSVVANLEREHEVLLKTIAAE